MGASGCTGKIYARFLYIDIPEERVVEIFAVFVSIGMLEEIFLGWYPLEGKVIGVRNLNSGLETRVFWMMFEKQM